MRPVRSDILIPVRGGKERLIIGELPGIAETPAPAPAPFAYVVSPGDTPLTEYFEDFVQNDHRKLGWLLGAGALGGLALLSSRHRGGSEGESAPPPVVPPPVVPPPVTTVPEPATAVLLASGLGLAYVLSRRVRLELRAQQ